ncbi:MAG: nucleoside deaminase [Bacteroidota bacterium]
MAMFALTDEYFMQEALKEAQKAYEEGEIPVGAVVVSQNRIIARAHNQVERLQDATAHAEMMALTAASVYTGGKYLPTCTLYVTLEPCPMCSGAAYWAQLGRLVFGASDERQGYRTTNAAALHPRTEVVHGVLAQASVQLLKDFFYMLRS